MTGNLTKRECHYCNAKKGRNGGCCREIDKLAPINTLRELAAFDRRHLVKNNNSAIIHFHPPAIRSIRFAVSLFRIRSRIGTKPRLNQGTLVSYMIPMSKRMGREIEMQWGGEFLRWQDTCTCREFIGRHSACNQEQPRLQPMPRRADQVGSLAAGASSSKSLNSIIEREERRERERELGGIGPLHLKTLVRFDAADR